MKLDDLLLADVEAFPLEEIPNLLGMLASLEAKLRLRLEATNGAVKHVGLMNPEQAAEFLNVKPHFVYEQARQKKLKAVRLGSYVRFRMEDVQAFIEEHREPEG